MVLLRNSLLWKCAPEQMSWLAAETAMLCTTKHLRSNYLWKASPLKLCHNPYQLTGNFQRTSYRFSFVEVMLQDDALFDIVHSAMGDKKVPRTKEACAALHMLGALHWLYNAQKLCCITLFPEFFLIFFFGEIHQQGARFQLLALV